MKTVMKEVMEKHDKEFNKMNFLKWLSDNRERLLEVEKEQIMKAWESGYSNGVRSVSRGEPKIKSSEEYYNSTFKSNE